MKARDFACRLKLMLPQTVHPIVPTNCIPVCDGLWVKSIETICHANDPIKVAKVKGLMNQKEPDGEIQIVLIDKEDYTEADLRRAVELISEADNLHMEEIV